MLTTESWRPSRHNKKIFISNSPIANRLQYQVKDVIWEGVWKHLPLEFVGKNVLHVGIGIKWHSSRDWNNYYDLSHENAFQSGHFRELDYFCVKVWTDTYRNLGVND